LITLHGIRNCDTVKKARAWLDASGTPYAFHDFKTQGLPPATLAAWVREHGWETLLNRAGTTFRKLPEAARMELDEARAVALMLEQPSMVKRPVLDLGGRRLVGFRPEAYAAALGVGASPPGAAPRAP
jgi:arsenate reductase (glutaredoxin)